MWCSPMYMISQLDPVRCPQALGVFDRQCGLLVSSEQLEGGSCPNFWHAPIDLLVGLEVYRSLLTTQLHMPCKDIFVHSCI